MSTRLDFHEVLCNILGTRQVYFQPPESVKMSYPAIVYERYDYDKLYADDVTYRKIPAYQVTIIDANPDSEIVEKVADLPFCSFDRHYESDNLNHDVFTIYY